MKLSTQIAVIGAGHAGVEAALAAARMGVDTVLFTLSLDAVANMPCNPSIGGTAKGHLVYEIDALGGEMGRAADRVTLQSRTLNLGKGAAVYSKRIQADRRKYQNIMKHTLELTPNLRLIQAEIVEILVDNTPSQPVVCGVRTHLGEISVCYYCMNRRRNKHSKFFASSDIPVLYILCSIYKIAENLGCIVQKTYYNKIYFITV